MEFMAGAAAIEQVAQQFVPLFSALLHVVRDRLGQNVAEPAGSGEHACASM